MSTDLDGYAIGAVRTAGILALLFLGYVLYLTAWEHGHSTALHAVSSARAETAAWRAASVRISTANDICRDLYNEVNTTLGRYTTPGAGR